MDWRQVIIPHEEEIAAVGTFLAFLGLISFWLLVLVVCIWFGFHFWIDLKRAAGI